MNQPPPKAGRLLWIGLGLTLALLFLAFLLGLLRLRERAMPPLPVYGQVAEFTLTNQQGEAVSLSDLRGEIWVADIIFTRCAGPCLRMSRRMQELQQALPESSKVKLVSLTTDPEYDTPSVLKQYAARFNADPSRWLFLTGTKQQIADLATGSLKLTSVEKEAEARTSPDDLFIHSTIFVLVDKQGQLRGVFESEGPDGADTQVTSRILSAIRRLARET